jgi:hypothetical protein
MNIFVIDNASGGLSYDIRWQLVCDELRTLENVESVTFIKGHRNKDYMFSNFYSASTLSTNMVHHLRNYAKKGSVFIFPNARDPLTITLKEYSEAFDLDFKLIGFWNDGSFYQHGDLRTKLRGKNYDWSDRFERSLVACYDYNLVTVESKLHTFRRIYSGRWQNKIMFCPLPFSSVVDNIRKSVADYDIVKEDLIVMNTTPDSTHDIKLFEALQKEFTSFAFINLYQANLSPAEYRKVLARAKILFSINQADSDPYYVLESMVLGCIPILPDIPIYAELYNSKWLYPNKLTRPPYINFIREGEIIREKIWNIQENYVNLNIAEETEKIIERHFSSDTFKQIIKNLAECKKT